MFKCRAIRNRFLLLLTPILIFSCASQNPKVSSINAMNTFMTIKTYGKNSSLANEQILERIKTLESLFSTTDPNSELYKFNHSQDEIFGLSSETYNLLEYGVQNAYTFEGHFNPFLYPVILEWGFTTGDYKIPTESEIFSCLQKTDFKKVQFLGENKILKPQNMMADLGSLAKGFLTDESVKILQKNGIKSAILDFGGNIYAFGKKNNNSLWRVGIKNPFGQEIQLAVNIENSAIITSGGYERFFVGSDGKKYIHIFDAKTGRPVQNDLASVTIICKNALYADLLSTSLFILGENDAIKYFKTHADFEMILIKTDNSLLYTSGLENKIEILGDFKSIQKI